MTPAVQSRAVERAVTYASIFAQLGDRWPAFVPGDAIVDDGTVYLSGVRIERDRDGWRVTGDGQSMLVRRKVDAGTVTA